MIILYLLLATACLMPAAHSLWADPRAVEFWTMQEATIALLALWGFVASLRRARKTIGRWSLTDLDLPALLFLTTAFLAALFSFDLYKSQVQFLRLLTLWFVFNLAAQAGQHGAVRRRLVQFMVWSGVVLALIAIGGWVWTGCHYRPSAGYPNPNHLADFLALAVLLGVPTLVRASTGAERITAALAAGLCLGALALTQSRGAFLGLAAGGLVFFFSPVFREKVWNRRLWPVLAVILTFLAVMGLPFLERIMDGGEQESLAWSRLLVWQSGARMAWDHLGLGVGPGVFGELYPTYRHPSVWLYGTDFAHNEYLQVIAEAGLPCFLALVWGVAILLINCGRSAFRKTSETGESVENTLFSVGVLAGLISVFTHAFVEFNLHALGIAVPVCILAGLSVNNSGKTLILKGRDFLQWSLISIAVLLTILTLVMAGSNLCYMAGYYAAMKGQRDPSVRWFERAIRLSPVNSKPYFELAKAFRANAQETRGVVSDLWMQRSELYLERAIKLSIFEQDYYVYSKEHYKLLKNDKKVYENVKKMVDINPNHPIARLEMAKYLSDKGLFNDSIREFNKAIEIEPNLPITYKELAKTYKKMGRNDEYAENVKKAKELDEMIQKSIKRR